MTPDSKLLIGRATCTEDALGAALELTDFIGLRAKFRRLGSSSGHASNDRARADMLASRILKDDRGGHVPSR